jgi:peptidoglycan/xylan/chitin deacetylase (PgdA/CDA1 family)
MVETSDLVHKVLGIRPKAIRFPGGSFNHLNKPYLDRLHELGFKIFDWTISGGDGSYPYNSPYLIFANATYADSLTNRAILLMHTKPNNANSVEALPSIIEFYKNNGYEFKTIDDDTTEYYYNMKSLQ